MDISAARTNINPGSSGYGEQPAAAAPVATAAVAGDDTNSAGVRPATVVTDDKGAKRQPKLADVEKMTAAMNQFTEAMDANIRFTIHDKTKELVVQVVDQTNNKVLKEFPPREFLDTIAAIRSYVGMLLDKKI